MEELKTKIKSTYNNRLARTISIQIENKSSLIRQLKQQTKKNLA